jgi:DNA-binding MurR/RpiR family transcriptional regulator
LLKQVTDNSLANARETLKQQSTDAIVTAARLVIEAETMYVIGLRGSSGTAQTFGFVFSQLRPQVRNLLEGGPVLLESLVSLSARDTVLAISVPRYTRWTIDALHHARRKGARTIVITDSAFSPAAQVADIALVVQIDALFSNSYAPVLLLLDVLAAAIFSIQPEAALARLDAIERMFDGHDFFFQAEDLPTMNAERRLREFSSFASARGSRQTKRQT